ncbi:MAG: exodeoxyribonuclease VII large subunit [Ruminococcus sp.]|nr:exodeoxyribonuclease VII large subunit [Ruminococcus sp.]
MSSILTVSQLNRYISFKLKEDTKLRGILIQGEISGFNHHLRSGHFYFTLKDGAAAVKAVMFSSFASRLQFTPQNGMSVIAMGSVQVFERDGVYQIYVTDMQPAGIGAQFLAAEQIKKRLSEMGIFDEAHKKPIPPFPEKVGIVTAKGGAALQDILNILARRYPLCEAVIFPCLVQGEYAVQSICGALEFADTAGCDVIICGRGGGSAEDLNAFNSEEIALAVYKMNTPVISAVGHETDVTVIDFVSDLRAPTPSAAAELAVPDTDSVTEMLIVRRKALESAFDMQLSQKKRELLIRQSQLKDHAPSAAIVSRKEKISSLKNRLASAAEIYLERKKSMISSRAAKLDELSPLKIMSRGYSLAYVGNRLIKSPDDVKIGDNIEIRLAQGSVTASVTGKGER